MSQTPRVFVSSTIYDFEDMRSATAYFLTSFGFNVQLSESTSFAQDITLSSYDSCLKVIDGCDYFVLFIGSRVGGRVKDMKGISITRAEYRRAWERFKKGHMRLVVFVRQSIWDTKDDRRALEEWLKDNAPAIDPELAKKIAQHPSKLTEDAAHIFDFVDEVRRAEDSRAKGSPTAGNWVYRFSTFQQVADALRVSLNIRGPLRQSQLAVNLCHEISNNICTLGSKSKQPPHIRFPFLWLASARQAFKGDIQGSTHYSGDHYVQIGLGLIEHACLTRLSTRFLIEAIESGEFVDFDVVEQSHRVSELQSQMLLLLQEIDRARSSYESANKSHNMTDMINRGTQARKSSGKIVGSDLLHYSIMSLHDHTKNVVLLSKYVYSLLRGKAARKPTLAPFNPFIEEGKKVEEERPDPAQVQVWLDS